MSLSFVVPQTGAQSWRASTLTKVHGAVKPLEVRSSVLVSTVAGGVAAATVAAAVATQSGRGSQKRGTCINIRAFEGELGVQAPVGFWDPLGLSEDGDAETFRRRRATELKHGRVAMIACVGYITPEFFRWPGFCSPSSQLEFSEIPNGLKAFSVVPGGGWLQMILFCLAMEKGFFVQDPKRAPGDFANGGVLGVPNKSTMPEGDERNRRLSAELANGRLAMMAIIGMFYQDGLTGMPWGDWSYYEASPLRAFENELGVQDPVGFWDPLGLAADGDAAVFRRRRESEIKHGRIAMIATLGYIVPGLGYRFAGPLSLSQGIYFEQMPNGLKAIKSVPEAGLAQFVLFCGLLETGFYRSDPARAPGDFKNGGVLGVPNASGPMSDGEARRRKLNAELANGRLAMMAIIGMFFQDGLTGAPWGDWSSYTASPLRAFENDLGLRAKTGKFRARGEKLGSNASGEVVDGGAVNDLGSNDASGDLGTNDASGEVVDGGAVNDFFDMTKQFGVTAPAGKPGVSYWDPAGLSKNIDADTFRQYRAAELKHGRICMVALIGLIAQHSWTIPAFRGEPSGIGAASTGHASGAGLALIIFLAGIIEYNTSDENREPGDFDDPFELIYLAGFNPNESDDLTLWRNRELNHCRLAMVGFLGSVMAEYATGLDAVDQWKFAEPAWNRTTAILSFPDSDVGPLSSFA